MAPSGEAKRYQELTEEYQAAAVSGDVGRARAIVQRELDAGRSVFDIYREIFVPAQRYLGDKWSEGEISISEEHRATQITIDEMTRLRGLIRPRPDLGKSVLVTTLSNDLHVLGARMVADYFFADGWRVDFLGANTPGEEVLKHIDKHAFDALVVSVTIEESVSEFEKLCVELSSRKSRPYIIAGGRGLEMLSAKKWGSLVDVVTDSPMDAVSSAREALGITGSKKSLQQTLVTLGQNIQTRRQAKSYSQAELARRAKLDRAYISSLENGKKNVSLAAVLRIAEALGAELTDLLRGDSAENNGS